MHLLPPVSVDTGGSGIKVIILDANGNPITERARLDTPQPATPEAILNAMPLATTSWYRASVPEYGSRRGGVSPIASQLNVKPLLKRIDPEEPHPSPPRSAGREPNFSPPRLRGGD